MAVRRPISFQIVVIVAALDAGPVIRNTSATPGDAPAANIAAAIGTEAVAHTYTGKPRASAISIASGPPPRYGSSDSAGTHAAIAPPMRMPTISGLATSRTSVPKP